MCRKAVRIEPSDQGQRKPRLAYATGVFLWLGIGRLTTVFFNNADYLMRVACRSTRGVHTVGRASDSTACPPAFAGLASKAKAAAWYAADRGSNPLTGTIHVEVSKWPKEPGRKPGELSSSQVQIHAFYSRHALVAQTVERLVETLEAGVPKPPRCAN